MIRQEIIRRIKKRNKETDCAGAGYVLYETESGLERESEGGLSRLTEVEFSFNIKPSREVKRRIVKAFRTAVARKYVRRFDIFRP